MVSAYTQVCCAIRILHSCRQTSIISHKWMFWRRYLNSNQIVELPTMLFQGLTSLQIVWVKCHKLLSWSLSFLLCLFRAFRSSTYSYHTFKVGLLDYICCCECVHSYILVCSIFIILKNRYASFDPSTYRPVKLYVDDLSRTLVWVWTSVGPEMHSGTSRNSCCGHPESSAPRVQDMLILDLDAGLWRTICWPATLPCLK